MEYKTAVIGKSFYHIKAGLEVVSTKTTYLNSSKTDFILLVSHHEILELGLDPFSVGCCLLGLGDDSRMTGSSFTSGSCAVSPCPSSPRTSLGCSWKPSPSPWPPAAQPPWFAGRMECCLDMMLSACHRLPIIFCHTLTIISGDDRPRVACPRRSSWWTGGQSRIEQADQARTGEIRKSDGSVSWCCGP